MPALTPTTTYKYSRGPQQGVAWQPVPQVFTDVETRDCYILGYCVSNPTGAALTFTIQTKDGTPLPLPLNGSLPKAGDDGSSDAFSAPFGVLCKGGFSVQASGPGLLFSATWI